ncbi:hypothetical protein HDV05_003524 [Chytridiales sp. JEL 0842]|nr:hypothetical protein HDV05_003524 [Chytridiales sp. JEL 0842]
MLLIGLQLDRFMTGTQMLGSEAFIDLELDKNTSTSSPNRCGQYDEHASHDMDVDLRGAQSVHNPAQNEILLYCKFCGRRLHQTSTCVANCFDMNQINSLSPYNPNSLNEDEKELGEAASYDMPFWKSFSPNATSNDLVWIWSTMAMIGITSQENAEQEGFLGINDSGLQRTLQIDAVGGLIFE